MKYFSRTIFTILLTIISGIVPAQMYAQTDANRITLGWKVLDQNSMQFETSEQRLFFDKAIYPDTKSNLPVLSERITFSGDTNNTIPKVILRSAVYEEMPTTELKALSTGIFKSDISVTAFYQTERKQDYIRYEFIPIRKNSNSGKIERLVSFVPEIQTTRSAATKTGTLRKYASNSMLATGKWVKIKVKETGIHKITYSQLLAMGFENPSQARIFGNGGTQLPYNSDLDRPDDLIENPSYLYKGLDGTFNEGDYLLFYAEGPAIWNYDEDLEMFIHHLHLYSDYIYYFITTDVGSGKRVTHEVPPGGVVTQRTNEYDDYTYREKDSINLIKSGRLWTWKHFAVNLNWGFNIDFPNKIADESIWVVSSLWSRSSRNSPNSSFILQVDGSNIATFSMPGINTGNYEALFASTSIGKTEIQRNNGRFYLSYQYVQSNPGAEAWLDYIDINTRSRLNYNGVPLRFRDRKTVGQNQITEFTVGGANENLFWWDVTELDNIRSISFEAGLSNLKARCKTDYLREFVIFDPTSPNILTPIIEGDDLGDVENQDLHGTESPEMIILVHDDLRDHAEELANFHQEHDGITSLIVSAEKIYNEFSSGTPDATAIRDFLKMYYDRSNKVNLKLKYLLFFGDGSYDNKKIWTDDKFRTCLPTFQSLESLYPTSSYLTDDYFGLLDDGEDLEPGLLDIGIGRFPVNTSYEAAIIVDKIKHYVSPATLGDWRNLICFIGDDEDNNGHMRDANNLAEIINSNFSTFNVDKIFLDAYQQVSVPAGQRYPEVNRAINDRIKKGALIMNYLGHGSERGLAHEEILTSGDIKSWDNYDKLPVFMTATCEFSRFDDFDLVSAGEWILLNPNGGGIALYTTTRLVYSSPNFRLNREFYDYAFNRPGGGRYNFGDIMRLTKNSVGNELNKLSFTLLGDPALSMNFPDHNIKMTHINDTPVLQFADTLKALSKTSVSGYFATQNGEKLVDYNGVVYPTVYDKKVTLNNLANDGGPIMEFDVQENILFRGKAKVTNGDFNFSFIVPKDIAYNIGPGKFSFYGTDGISDAAGVNLEIKIGGSADSVFADHDGPEVKLFMNDTTFVYGGLTHEDPVFLARVTDNNGINTTGNGIGHDITAILDDNRQDILVLNDYYESDLDEYQSGSIRYPLSDLEPGEHNIKFKVWDILNNSSESEMRFIVESSAQIVLKNLLNYPNPFTTHTEFYFEHNQGHIPLDVQIQIFTIGGRLVKSFSYLGADENQVAAGSYRVGPVVWDGLDDYGDRIGRGTYVYRVRVRTPDGRIQEAFQKLVKL